MSRHCFEQKFGFSRGEMGRCSGANSWMVQEQKQDKEQDVHVRGKGWVSAVVRTNNRKWIWKWRQREQHASSHALYYSID